MRHQTPASFMKDYFGPEKGSHFYDTGFNDFRSHQHQQRNSAGQGASS